MSITSMRFTVVWTKVFRNQTNKMCKLRRNLRTFFNYHLSQKTVVMWHSVEFSWLSECCYTQSVNARAVWSIFALDGVWVGGFTNPSCYFVIHAKWFQICIKLFWKKELTKLSQFKRMLRSVSQDVGRGPYFLVLNGPPNCFIPFCWTPNTRGWEPLI